jgi:hypothetical protein
MRVQFSLSADMSEGSERHGPTRCAPPANCCSCRTRLLKVCASLRPQGRDVWSFVEQAWIAHRRGGEMPSLLPSN